MKKGLALLLAASMAFSGFSTAFAADPQTAEEKYNALVEAGIFDGMDDGLPHLEDNMTRAQAAKIVTVLLGLDEDAAASSIYTDLVGAEWAAGYIGAATEAGILEGRGNGVFDPSADVTVQELAKIMVEALDLEVDNAATVDGADEWAQAYVAAAVEAGIIPSQADYTVPAVRSILVEASYTAHSDILPAASALTADVQLKGASEVVLSFNKDATDATVTVKRGASTIAAQDVIFSEDGKSATLKFANKLLEGDYTVTASIGSGESQESVTAAFVIEAEYVADIEISSIAPLSRKDAEKDTVVFSYVTIKNQYGEVVTEDYIDDSDLTIEFDDASYRVVDKKSGLLKVTADAGDEFDDGDEIDVDIEFDADEKEHDIDIKTFVTVEDASEVSEIEVVGLYNLVDEDDKTLTFDDYEDWALAFVAKDQYGLPVAPLTSTGDIDVINDYLLQDVDMDTDDDDILEILDADTNPFSIEDIDGEDYFVVKFDNTADADDQLAGTVVVEFDHEGGTTEYEVEVTDVVRVDTIQLSQPASAPYNGKEIIIPFVALDQNGEEVWDDDVLTDDPTDPERGLLNLEASDGTIEFRNNPKTGKAELVLDLSGAGLDEDDDVDVEIETYTGNEEEITIQLDDAAEAVSITEVDDDFKLAYLLSDSNTGSFEIGDLTFADQYGEELEDSDLDFINSDNVDGTADEEYRIQVKSSNDEVLSISNGVADRGNSEEEYLYDGAETLTVTPEKKGTVSLTLTLQQWDDDRDEKKWVNKGAHTLRIRVVEPEDVESFTATVEDAVYTYSGNSATDKYAVEVEVEGVLSNGTTLFVPYSSSLYEVTTNSSHVQVGTNGDDERTLYATNFNYDDGEDTDTAVATVIVNGAKEQKEFVIDVTVSKKTPETAELKLDEDKDGEYEADGNILYIADTFFGNANSDVEIDRILRETIEAKDQYGEELTEDAGFYTYITGQFSDDDVVDRQGLQDMKDSHLNEKDSFNVTAIANDSNKRLSFKVIIVKPSDID